MALADVWACGRLSRMRGRAAGWVGKAAVLALPGATPSNNATASSAREQQYRVQSSAAAAASVWAVQLGTGSGSAGSD